MRVSSRARSERLLFCVLIPMERWTPRRCLSPRKRRWRFRRPSPCAHGPGRGIRPFVRLHFLVTGVLTDDLVLGFQFTLESPLSTLFRSRPGGPS